MTSRRRQRPPPRSHGWVSVADSEEEWAELGLCLQGVKRIAHQPAKRPGAGAPWPTGAEAQAPATDQDDDGPGRLGRLGAAGQSRPLKPALAHQPDARSKPLRSRTRLLPCSARSSQL
jgi:hypothetical protein